MESPRLIQYWRSQRIPSDVYKLCQQTRARNDSLRHQIFDHGAAAEMIRTRLGHREHAAFEACAVPAMQADYFRYCAVFALGGIYCDADSACTGSLKLLLEADGTLFFFERKGEPRVMINHIFAFREPGHPLLRLAIDIATVNVESRFTELVPFVAGQPILMLLQEIRRTGSIDEYIDRLQRGWLSRRENARIDHRRWHEHFDVVRTVIGDYSRVKDAFTGVRVRSYHEVSHLVDCGDSNLAYRRTSEHYPNWSGSIYR